MEILIVHLLEIHTWTG